MAFLNNTLVSPSAFEVPDFETVLQQQKISLLDLIREQDAGQADAVAQTLASDSELLTKFMRNNALQLQAYLREANSRYLQTLPAYAVESNLDALAAQVGLERDADESDEHLRLRYFLNRVSPARGTRLGYIARVRQLDDAPTQELINHEDGFSIRYRVSTNSLASRLRDVNAVRANPGEVDIVFLAGNDADNDALKRAIESVMTDEKLLTDKVTVQAGEVLPYSLVVTLGVFDEPDSDTIKATFEASLLDYTKKQQRLGASIEPTEIIHLGREAGSKRVTLANVEPIQATPYQVPVMHNLTVTTELI